MGQSIEAAIRRRLGRDAVSVAFDDGVVTLSGTVRSWQEQRTAEDAARLSPGLRDVVDRTTIEP
jgi:osmotically-inducible protein OsmY